MAQQSSARIPTQEKVSNHRSESFKSQEIHGIIIIAGFRNQNRLLSWFTEAIVVNVVISFTLTRKVPTVLDKNNTVKQTILPFKRLQR